MVRNNPPTSPPEDEESNEDDEPVCSVGLGVSPATKPEVSALGPPRPPVVPVAATALATGAPRLAPLLSTTAPPVICGRGGTDESAGTPNIPAGAGATGTIDCTCDLGSWALPGTTAPMGAGVGDGSASAAGVGDSAAGGSAAGVGDGVGDSDGSDAAGARVNCPMFALLSVMVSACPPATAPGHIVCMQLMTAVIPLPV